MCPLGDLKHIPTDKEEPLYFNMLMQVLENHKLQFVIVLQSQVLQVL